MSKAADIAQLKRQMRALTKGLGIVLFEFSEDVALKPDGKLSLKYVVDVDIRNDLRLLMEHLGLEFEEGKRIVKKAPEKKK